MIGGHTTLQSLAAAATQPATQQTYVYVSGPMFFAIATGATFMWLLFALFFWALSNNKKDGGSQPKAIFYRVGMWMGGAFAALTFVVGFVTMASEWF